LASDEDFTLFSVVIFRRVHEEFINKCRENKFIVRDFVFSEESVHTQREELETADVTEKELWVFRSSPSLALTPLTVALDGTTSLGPDELLRGIPVIGAPQSVALVCGECASVWITRQLHRISHQGEPLPSSRRFL
jgi:hypothetical protein